MTRVINRVIGHTPEAYPGPKGSSHTASGETPKFVHPYFAPAFHQGYPLVNIQKTMENHHF